MLFAGIEHQLDNAETVDDQHETLLNCLSDAVIELALKAEFGCSKLDLLMGIYSKININNKYI